MTKRLFTLLIVLISLASFGSAMATEKFDLPADLQKLLPEYPTALVAITSVNDLADQYVDVMASFDENATRSEVVSSLAEVIPNFLEFVDLDKPFAFAAGLPNLMAGGEPPLTYIVPMNPSFAGRDTMLANAGFAAQAIEGNYVALSSDPYYTPGTTMPDLVEHLAPGVISATLNLATVVENFGPFIEMGLAGIPTQTPDNPEGFTTDEAAAIGQTLRDVMHSVNRLDVALGRDGDLITWHTGLGVIPGSALDAGPQPDFDRALALTKALPNDADFLQVLALDQTRIFETFREYYLITMKGALSGMEAQQAEAYGVWVEEYITAMDIWASPMAAALRVDPAGMAAHVVIEPADADDALDKLTNIIGGMTALDIGYTLTARQDEKIAGVNFHVWDLDFDLEKFEAVMPDNTSPAVSGTDRMQAEQMVSIMRKIMPVVYLGAKDGKLFMASDSDTEALAQMVKAAGKGGKPVAAVAKIADQAGPACQQVITGDMLAIINWVTELMEEVDDEERALMKGHPIPFEATFIMNNPDLGFNMGMDLQAMGNLIKAVEELDAISSDSTEEVSEEMTEEVSE